MRALRWLRWRFDTHMHSKALRAFIHGYHYIRFDHVQFLMGFTRKDDNI